MAEKVLNQGITLVISVVLARLLAPEDYGSIALVNVFILIANVFIQNGIGVALIQDKEADETDFSTDFFISIILGLLLYLILFFLAVPIGNFYEDASLIPIVRVLGLRLPLASIYTIQYAIVSRRMQFKKLFAPTLAASAISGTTGIVMAYLGFGVWALVAQTLLIQIFLNIFLFVALRWRPGFVFRTSKALQHISFSIKVTLAELLNTLVGQLNTLVIGKVYSSADVAYYNNGTKYPQAIVGIITSAVDSVMFPAIANNNDSPQMVKQLMRRSVRGISFFIAPMMIGFALCAEYAVSFFLTDKWLPSVPYMRIICAIYLLMPMNSVNYQGVKAIGKSALFLKQQIVKSLMNVSILFLVYRHGMMAIALSALVGNVGILFINAYPAHKYIGYTVFEQLKDLSVAWLYALPFAVVLVLFNYWVHLSIPLMLAADIAIGAVLYFVTAYLFKSEELNFALEKLKKARS